MRSTTAWIGVLILGGGAVFWWQRTEIARLRTRVNEQGTALASNQRRLENLSLALGGTDEAAAPVVRTMVARGLRQSDDGADALRADERRLILDQYRDVLAGMNLPAETAARLQDLLANRIETVLDAEDAAMRVGFAAGSAGTARAVAMAVEGVDREIVGLVGADRTQILDQVPSANEPQPVVIPQPVAPSVVNVIVQAPPPASYGDAYGEQVASDVPAAAPYVPYYYYYAPGVLVGPGFRGRGLERPIGGAHTAGGGHRAVIGGRAVRTVYRGRL